jgi:hypothetical protein
LWSSPTAVISGCPARNISSSVEPECPELQMKSRLGLGPAASPAIADTSAGAVLASAFKLGALATKSPGGRHTRQVRAGRVR